MNVTGVTHIIICDTCGTYENEPMAVSCGIVTYHADPWFDFERVCKGSYEEGTPSMMTDEHMPWALPGVMAHNIAEAYRPDGLL